MLVKALVGFAGKVSMHAGEIKEIEDDAIAKDLLNAGYIEEVKAKAEEKKPATKSAKSKK